MRNRLVMAALLALSIGDVQVRAEQTGGAATEAALAELAWERKKARVACNQAVVRRARKRSCTKRCCSGTCPCRSTRCGSTGNRR
jgi:hypothetical protein